VLITPPMDGIAITYQTLFEVLQTEKKRKELQELDKEFYAKVAEYLQEKQKASKDARHFGSDAHAQYDKARRIMREIYNWREQKIAEMARNKARAEQEAKHVAIDTEALLPEEEDLFDSLRDCFMSFRKERLSKVMDGKHRQEQKSPGSMVVRFNSSTEQFVGRDLETYGPFEQEDVASLPVEVAGLLIKNGKAEEIHTS